MSSGLPLPVAGPRLFSHQPPARLCLPEPDTATIASSP